MLSVVLPSYNGARILDKELPGFLQFLENSIKEYEVIIVDDGSESWENTQEVAKKHNCRFERNPENQGKGAAVKRGVNAAKGEEIIFTDVDIPFQYENLLTFYEVLKEGNPFVIGDRTLEGSKYFEDISPWRKAGSKVFTFIIGKMFTKGLYDTQCGLKGFKKEAAQSLFKVATIPGFAFDVELLVASFQQNIPISRRPVVLRSVEGDSVRLLKHGLIMMRDLFKIKINQLRKKYSK